MKLHRILIILFATIPFASVAQTQDTVATATNDTVSQKPCNNPSSDTAFVGPMEVIHKKCDGQNKGTTIIWGRTNISKNNKSALSNAYFSWFGFDLGFNNYIDKSAYGTPEVNNFVRAGAGQQQATEDMLSLRNGKSVNVNIWPIMLKVNLIHHYLGFKTALGIEMNNYRYSRNLTYVNNLDNTYMIKDSVNFKKDKLFTEYLTVPLMLTFESNPYHNDKSFHLAAGATFGYLVKSRTKQISSERGKVKDNNPFNLEKFRTGLRAEIGYGGITFYGSYYLTPIHQYGLKQYPFAIGLALIR